MTNIAASGYAAYIRQTITRCSITGTTTGTIFDKPANAMDITYEQTTFEGMLFEIGSQTPLPESIGAPDRWTSEQFYTIDLDTLEGYRVNRAALERVKAQLQSEGIDAHGRTPTHEITDEQMEWLGSRYDLDFLSICSFEHPDFGNFMLDLAYLNVFSLDEVENMYGVLPFNANHKGYLYKLDTGDGLSGYVNPFGGTGNYVDEDDMYTQLIMEYLKIKYTGRTEKEYERMTEDFIAQQNERMNVLRDFFNRAAERKTDKITTTIPHIEDISEKLKNDFGSLIREQ